MKRFKIIFVGMSEDFSFIGCTTMEAETQDSAVARAKEAFTFDWGTRGGQMDVRKVVEIPINEWVKWNIDGEVI